MSLFPRLSFNHLAVVSTGEKKRGEILRAIKRKRGVFFLFDIDVYRCMFQVCPIEQVTLYFTVIIVPAFSD